MAYASAVVERTMKVQGVMLQPMSGKRTWVQAEEIVGWSPRTLCCAGACATSDAAMTAGGIDDGGSPRPAPRG